MDTITTRRALELLAGSRDGCQGDRVRRIGMLLTAGCVATHGACAATEAIMLAHGFKIELLARAADRW